MKNKKKIKIAILLATLLAFSISQVSITRGAGFDTLRPLATDIMHSQEGQTQPLNPREAQRLTLQIYIKEHPNIQQQGEELTRILISSFYKALYQLLGQDEAEFRRIAKKIEQNFKAELPYFDKEIQQLSEKYNIPDKADGPIKINDYIEFSENIYHPVIFDVFLTNAYMEAAEYIIKQHPEAAVRKCIEFTRMLGDEFSLSLGDVLGIDDKLKQLEEQGVSRLERIEIMLKMIDEFITKSTYYYESEMIFEGIFNEEKWDKEGITNIIYHMAYPWVLAGAIRLKMLYDFAHHPTTRTYEAFLLKKFGILATEIKKGEGAFDPCACMKHCDRVDEKWVFIDLERFKKVNEVDIDNKLLVVLLEICEFNLKAAAHIIKSIKISLEDAIAEHMKMYFPTLDNIFEILIDKGLIEQWLKRYSTGVEIEQDIKELITNAVRQSETDEEFMTRLKEQTTSMMKAYVPETPKVEIKPEPKNRIEKLLDRLEKISQKGAFNGADILSIESLITFFKENMTNLLSAHIGELSAILDVFIAKISPTDSLGKSILTLSKHIKPTPLKPAPEVMKPLKTEEMLAGIKPEEMPVVPIAKPEIAKELKEVAADETERTAKSLCEMIRITNFDIDDSKSQKWQYSVSLTGLERIPRRLRNMILEELARFLKNIKSEKGHPYYQLIQIRYGPILYFTAPAPARSTTKVIEEIIKIVESDRFKERLIESFVKSLRERRTNPLSGGSHYLLYHLLINSSALRPLASNRDAEFLTSRLQRNGDDDSVGKLKKMIAESTGDNFIYSLDAEKRNVEHHIVEKYKDKDIVIHQFELPFGGNLHLIEYKDRKGQKKYTMVESGCGVYYKDILKMFEEKGINPKHIEQILITHYDVDHSGAAGYFAEESGIPIWTHRNSPMVIENRLPGDEESKRFTDFANSLMGMKIPPEKHLKFFSEEPEGSIEVGGLKFNVIGHFEFDRMEFKALENIGLAPADAIQPGTHTQDTVYFYNPEDGILFSGDSFSHLDIKGGLLESYREDFLLTLRSLFRGGVTSANEGLMGDEMRAFIRESYQKDKVGKKPILVFSGHGRNYPLNPLGLNNRIMAAKIEISGLYHEMQNTIMAVKRFAESLISLTEKENVKQVAGHIIKIYERINNQITDLRKKEIDKADIMDIINIGRWVRQLRAIIKLSELPKELIDILFKEERLTEERLTHTERGEIEGIKRNTDRAKKLLEDYIETIRGERLHIKREKGDINSILDLSILDVNVGLVHQTEIKESFNPNLPPFYVDSDKLSEVFINLIKNAIEAMDFKGQLTIKTQQKDDTVVIKIADKGPGIRKEDLERIFDPFFTTKKGGAGLGLPICKNIIEAHGGKIEVNSKKGKGTTFTITLPISIPPYTNQSIRIYLRETESWVSQIGEAGQIAGDLAVRIGIDKNRIRELKNTIYELAHNILRHAKGGEIIIRINERYAGRKELEVTGIDSGPGIKDVEKAISDSFVSRLEGKITGGNGLIRMLVNPDTLIIESDGKRWEKEKERFEMLFKGQSPVKQGAKIVMVWHSGIIPAQISLDAIYNITIAISQGA